VTRTVVVIGIGAGHPDHLTLQAVAAMNRVDVFFTIDKGDAAADLTALRMELLARHATRPHRVVTAPEIPRDRDPADYLDTATTWQARREALYEEMITAELVDGQTGGFLVWGDPSLYDGTLILLHRIAERTDDKIEIVAVPGISAISALAAAHRLVLNRVGASFLVTTGRRLADEGMPRDVDDVVVLLDGRQAFATLPDADLDVFWGAYLGTSDEILVAGDLPTVRDEILRQRTRARERKGWIMDTYLLRRRRPDRGGRQPGDPRPLAR
jgi:precorrin-6A synthase